MLQPDAVECQSLLGNCYAADVTELLWLLHNLPEKDRATEHHATPNFYSLHILSVGKHSRSLQLAAEIDSSDEHSPAAPRTRR